MDSESTRFLDALLRYGACTISVLSADGRVVSTRADDAPTLGYDDMTGYSTRDVIHPDDLALYEEIEGLVLANPGVEFDCQLRIRHREGHYEVIECTARNMLDHPVINGVVLTTRNVSRRHQHDRLLADSNAALEAIAAGRELTEVAVLVRDLMVHQDSVHDALPADADALFAALEGDESPGGVQARWILTLAMSSHRATE